MRYMSPVKVVEATSRNKHKRSLDGFFCVCVRRLLKVFLKQKAGRWGQKCYCDPQAMIYKQSEMLCTVHFSNGDRIQTTCLEWAKCCFVVNYESCKRFFPTGKVHAPPHPICLPASAWKQKKRSLGSNGKTRRVGWARTSVANRMLLLLDFAELVKSIIYSYCWSFLQWLLFFPAQRLFCF